MLKEKSLRKILVSTACLFALVLLYLIPKNEDLTLNVKQELEYVNNNVITNEIFLLNNHGMLAKTKVVVSGKSTLKLVKEIIGILTVGGIGENKIPR